jgi:hypothetical protein
VADKINRIYMALILGHDASLSLSLSHVLTGRERMVGLATRRWCMGLAGAVAGMWWLEKVLVTRAAAATHIHSLESATQ